MSPELRDRKKTRKTVWNEYNYHMAGAASGPNTEIPVI